MNRSGPIRWTLSLSWGPNGGRYLHRHRICLWRLAVTFLSGVEIDDLMEAYVDQYAPLPRKSAARPPGSPLDGGRPGPSEPNPSSSSSTPENP